MSSPDPYQAENLAYFLTEAQDLLQTLEQKLVSLHQERTTACIHDLMRVAHTLKGASASVGQRAIQEVSHVLEDIFKALYNPDLEIDAEVESLLFEGYECLRRPIAAALHGETEDESEVMNRAAGIIARLQEKFGDAFDPNAAIPTSAELGFDMVQSMFEVGVTQYLEKLKQAIHHQDAIALAKTLQSQAEMFLGFAESLNLPGFGAIAQTTLQALNAHPDQAVAIAQIALEDFSRGRELVLGGDRTEGGTPSAALQQWATGQLLEELLSEELLSGEPLLEEPLPEEPLMETQSDDLFDWEDTDPTYLSITEGELIMDEACSAPLATNLNASKVEDDTDSDLSDLIAALEDEIFQGNTSIPAPPMSTPIEVTPVSSQAVEVLDEASDLADLVSAVQEKVLQNGSYAQAASNGTSRGGTFPSSITEQSVNYSGASTDPSELPGIEVSGSAALTETTPKTSTPIRVDLKHLENLNHFTGELLINQNRQTTQNESLRGQVQSLVQGLQRHQQLLYNIQAWADQWLIRASAQATPGFASWQGELSSTVSLTSQGLSSSMSAFDALEIDHYTGLHSLVQGALTDFSTLESTAETVRQLVKQNQRTIQGQQRFLTHIRDDLTNMRMAPLETIFNRFPSMLERLTKTHQKPTEIHWVGGNVQVDKAIADKLYDPLLHLIRNAFDHGIESPETRQMSGKKQSGQIRIEAYNQGRHTIIEVSDDGVGIDIDRIRQRVVKLGLANSENAARYSDDQLLDFLFKPGFSTREQVSDLSGRGMGLDIVRSQLTAMGGSVQLYSRPQQGTTFILQLPLSFSITKMLVCQVGSVAYALPVQQIERILLPKPHAYKIHAQRRALQVFEPGYEPLIPLRSLDELLTYAAGGERVVRSRRYQQSAFSKPQGHSEYPYILLLHSKEKKWALQVERILGEQELVVRPLKGMNPPDYIYGGTIFGDNDMALAIDPDVLLQSEDTTAQPITVSPVPRNGSQRFIPVTPLPAQVNHKLLTAAPTHIEPQPSGQSPKRYILLVVDDSITLRKMLTATLEQRGYRVVQAQDGQDAIEKLNTHYPVDLVLCDIEMPRLNGFEFLAYSRQHPDLSKIPVVMLTSRTTEKHRQLALGLGANGYVTKPYTDDRLLSTLEKVLEQTLEPSMVY
ncbi:MULTISPECIES: hybrid sensor histidine kinase/response regulator [unclassified Leptolyngbya]|uniref:hybrid sensor histidine kinase/response regulator n=1 Tax=unclassified Leptolyngbya TaxID=2650499 RepID=UPI001682F953|nr:MULTISPECIES: hybrid sensor histidine kinase/response regulator [unclassified Leptolyngbya]MBD1909426.1 hybrid sensor histidine kinase/response regulator [Leptolyngbya sp. FACHB-8]MBD2158590.1 hybrid sensor histidine kinase/response regulator [Leptolyngbya sp. FACHB-16]